jgi:hypothetical protein
MVGRMVQPHLNRIASSAGKPEGCVGDDRVANDNAELAITAFVIGLARPSGWISSAV